jgi:hypothetical protein
VTKKRKGEVEIGDADRARAISTSQISLMKRKLWNSKVYKSLDSQVRKLRVS